MKKVNPYLLGICIAYVILGIKQVYANGILLFKIYYMISIVSFNVSFTELLKVLYKYLKQYDSETKYIIYIWNLYLKSTDNKLKSDISQNDFFLRFEKEKEKYNSRRKNIVMLFRISEISILFSYVNSVCLIILIPLMNISNDLSTNKISGAITLFCFALMFFINFLNDLIDEKSNEFDLKKKEIINGLMEKYNENK